MADQQKKVAVITGASQGIGAALARAYRDRDYRVVATACSAKPSTPTSWSFPAISAIGRRRIG